MELRSRSLKKFYSLAAGARLKARHNSESQPMSNHDHGLSPLEAFLLVAIVVVIVLAFFIPHGR